MVMQRHEEIKHHKGPRPCVDPTPLDARGAVFFVLSHTLVLFPRTFVGFPRTFVGKEYEP